MIQVKPISGDATAGLQTAIDAALGPANPATAIRVAREGVRVLAGLYVTSVPVNVLSAQGLEITCEYGARIAPNFTGAAAWNFNGCCRCYFAGLWIQGTGKEQLDSAISYGYDGKVARSTSTCVFERCRILGTRYKVGIQVGTPSLTTQCDQTSFRDIELDGRWQQGESTWWQKGLVVGSNAWGNNLGHRGSGIDISGHARNLSIEGSQITIDGCNLGHGEVDVWYMGNGYAKIGSFRSEQSERLLYVYPMSSPANIALEQVTWAGGALAADGVWIDHRGGGVVRLTDVTVASTPRAPRIVLDGPVEQAIVLDNLCAAGYYAQDLIVRKNPQAAADVRLFTRTDNGHVTYCQ